MSQLRAFWTDVVGPDRSQLSELTDPQSENIASADAEPGGPAPFAEARPSGGGRKRPGGPAPADPKAGADRLAELARDPRQAHRAWKKLNAGDRGIVLAKMKQRYGTAFADQFRDAAERGKANFELIYWQPNLGPTPEKLKAGGWRFLEMEVTGTAAIDVEIWVHPSGKTLRRDVSPTQAAPPKSEKTEDEDELTTLRKKFEDIKRRLWPAMADFESNVERLESKPADEDRSPIDAAIGTSRSKVRNLITDLTNLQQEADDIDESLGNEINDEWASASEQYSGLLARYNAIQ